MWRWLWFGSVLAISFVASSSENAYQNIELKKFPDFESSSLAKIKDHRPTYIKFWATWCQPCMQQMPHFEALRKKYKDQVNILAVNININEELSEIENVIERFGLSMPVWLDNEGELGVALGLVGTPYSVLINRAGELVYTSHKSDENLDKFIDMLARGQELTPLHVRAPSPEQTTNLLKPWQQGEHLLFFTATWCDWYLEKSRPAMSQQCKVVQSDLNNLVRKFPNSNWHGIANHLWTDEKALDDFIKLYQLETEFSIDKSGVLFNHFKIRKIPSLLWIKDGKIKQRITDFSNPEDLLSKLK